MDGGHGHGTGDGVPDHRGRHEHRRHLGGLLIARWRVMAIIIGTLWLGAIALGLIAGVVL